MACTHWWDLLKSNVETTFERPLWQSDNMRMTILFLECLGHSVEHYLIENNDISYFHYEKTMPPMTLRFLRWSTHSNISTSCMTSWYVMGSNIVSTKLLNDVQELFPVKIALDNDHRLSRLVLTLCSTGSIQWHIWCIMYHVSCVHSLSHP